MHIKVLEGFEYNLALDAVRDRLGRVASKAGPILLYALLGVLAIAVPIALRVLDFKAVRALGDGKEPELGTIFALCAETVLLIVAGVEIRNRKLQTATAQDLLPLVLPIAFGLYLLIFLGEFWPLHNDYGAYQDAARAILAGTNPWQNTGLTYYPPLLPLALAKLYRFFHWLIPGATDNEFHWRLVHYTYQCLQYFLALLACGLSYRFARLIGLSVQPAWIIVSAVFVVNEPLFTTLTHNQVNLWILNSILLAVLLFENHPVWAGLAIAVGAHLKLYPLILLVPLAMGRRWRAIAASIAWCAAMVLLETDWGRDFGLWKQFLGSAGSFDAATNLRANSLHALIEASFRIGQNVSGWNLEPFHRDAYVLIKGVFVAWFVFRAVDRHRNFARPAGAPSFGGDARHPAIKVIADCMDALAFMVLMAPHVWHHHYLFTLPIILWSAVVRGRERYWLVGIGACLVLGLPRAVDLYPFSFHRIVGLCMLMAATPGAAVRELAARLSPADSVTPVVAQALADRDGSVDRAPVP